MIFVRTYEINRVVPCILMHTVILDGSTAWWTLPLSSIKSVRVGGMEDENDWTKVS